MIYNNNAMYWSPQTVVDREAMQLHCPGDRGTE